MALVVLVRGGRDARRLSSMVIFTNNSSSYPIRKLSDTVSGFSYRSAPNGFLNRGLMREWLKEPRCWGLLLNSGTRLLWMDN